MNLPITSYLHLDYRNTIQKPFIKLDYYRVPKHRHHFLRIRINYYYDINKNSDALPSLAPSNSTRITPGMQYYRPHDISP